MKKLLLIYLLLTAAVAKGQTLADSVEAPSVNEALDNRYGFLGNRFETLFTSYKGLVFVENRNGYKVYKKAVEAQTIGNAKITSVRYSFYKGQLAAVQAKAPNTLTNEQAWRELLKAAYGPAQDSVESKEVEDASYGNYGGSYLWSGRKAYINFSVYLGRDMSIYVASGVIDRRKKADEAAALKQAAKKL